MKPKRTANDIRRSLSFYTDPDAHAERRPLILTVLAFLLRSVCLTVEVFLRSRLGKKYITEPKALIGSLFPYLYLVLARIDIYYLPEFNPARPGAIEIAKPAFRTMRQFNLDETKARLEDLWRNLTDPNAALDVLYPVFIAIGIFGVVANLRFLGNLLGEYVLHQRRHPYSSGDPLFIWDPLYLLIGRFNLRTDIVKQFAEPILCIALGWQLKLHLPGDLKFLGVWATCGGIAIFIQEYLENHKRSHLVVERIANEMNSESFQAQDSLSIPLSSKDEVVLAKGRA